MSHGDGEAPLDGIRVVEIASVILGPYAGQILGDLGADVIKIEPPYGDSNRRIGPYRECEDLPAFFIGCNRNKRSLVLDLKKQQGVDAAKKLISGADVLLHNCRPGAIERIGLTYPEVVGSNPGLVYCATYGFGGAGEYAGMGAFDDSVQAVSGLAQLQGSVLGEPAFLPTLVADKTTALFAVQAILAALYHRGKSGLGQEIEVPMFESVASWLMVEHLWGQSFEPTMGGPGYPRLLARDRRPYRCRDGRYLAVLPYRDAQWREFCEVAGRAELADDPRFHDLRRRSENIEATYRVTSEIMAEQTREEWMRRLQDTSVPVMFVSGMEELVDDPHLEAVGFWHMVEHPQAGRLRMPRYPANFTRTPASVRRYPPRLGEHSREVLEEAGYEDPEIAEMLAAGVTAEPA